LINNLDADLNLISYSVKFVNFGV